MNYDDIKLIPEVIEIERLEQEIEDIKIKRKEYIRKIQEVASSGIKRLSTNDAGYLAFLLYWNFSSVLSTTIKEASDSRPDGIKTIREAYVEKTCVHCNDITKIKLNSRTQYNSIKKDKGIFVCNYCNEKEKRKIQEEYDEKEKARNNRLIELHTMPYSKYLESDEWKETRDRALKRARFKCQVCNGSVLLNVHHRTYERRGYEENSDLIVLCKDCHEHYHFDK